MHWPRKHMTWLESRSKNPPTPSQPDLFYPELMGKVCVTCCPLSDTLTFSEVIVLVVKDQSAKIVEIPEATEVCTSEIWPCFTCACKKKTLWPLSKLAATLLGFFIYSLLLCHLCNTPSLHTPQLVNNSLRIWRMYVLTFSTCLSCFLFILPSKYVVW